jgi:hypothetical protein
MLGAPSAHCEPHCSPRGLVSGPSGRTTRPQRSPQGLRLTCPVWTLTTRLQRSPRAPARTTFAVLHVCRRSLRNVLGQDGTRRDVTGYRLRNIPGGCEVRARFC